MNIYTLPKYILWQHPQAKITPLKLQKLLYYVKAWGIVAGVDLYNGEFERWDYGPVNPKIYHYYKMYGRKAIPVPAHADEPSDYRPLIDFILETYLPLSAISLSAMTHKEAPWRDTAPGDTVSHAKILSYYSQQPFAKNFIPTFNPTKNRYYSVQSDSWHAFVLDMTKEDAERHAELDSYQQYLEYLNQARSDIIDLEQTLHDLVD